MSGMTDLWRRTFATWPAHFRRKGVLTPVDGEAIPFSDFLMTDTVLVLERPTPDNVGARRVAVPFERIDNLKYTEPLKTDDFLKAGFVAEMSDDLLDEYAAKATGNLGPLPAPPQAVPQPMPVVASVAMPLPVAATGAATMAPAPQPSVQTLPSAAAPAMASQVVSPPSQQVAAQPVVAQPVVATQPVVAAHPVTAAPTAVAPQPTLEQIQAAIQQRQQQQFQQ